jgi:hypothetical protein
MPTSSTIDGAAVATPTTPSTLTAVVTTTMHNLAILFMTPSIYNH